MRGGGPIRGSGSRKRWRRPGGQDVSAERDHGDRGLHHWEWDLRVPNWGSEVYWLRER